MSLNDSVKVLIGLPALNEAESISPLLKKIGLLNESTEWDVEVLLFDDGSTDNTKIIFEKHCVANTLKSICLGDGVNHGLGYGVREIITYFLNDSVSEYLVLMDCDDTHDPAQINEMYTMMQTKGAQVAIASRYVHGSQIFGLSATRKVISALGGLYLRLLFPFSRVRDFTCGYRMYNRESLLQLGMHTNQTYFRSNNFSCMPEILLELYGCDVEFCEIPMILHYDQKLSESKMKFFKNIREILLLGIRMRIRRV